MAFFGIGRNDRPPRDFEAERRRLGERYLELDRTATRDAAGVDRPPAGLFVDADEAAGYLGARARSQALPIEAPTTAGTVAQYRASLARPPAISGTPFVMGPPPGQNGAQMPTREGPRVEPNQPAPMQTARAAARPPVEQTNQPPLGMPGITINLGGSAGAPPAPPVGPPPAPPVGPPAGLTAQTPPPPMDPAGQTVPAPEGPRAEPNQGTGQWKRNKRTGELRFFADPAGQTEPTREGPRVEPNQGTGARPPAVLGADGRRYAARPAEGETRENEIFYGLRRPARDNQDEQDARREGLKFREKNTSLSAAARADASRQLAELDRQDRRAEAFRMADRQDATTRYVADAAAAGEVAKAQAAAAGKSPVFALPNGKQAMVVGNTLVDAQTQEILADARSTGGIDPMVFMSATDEQRKLMIEKKLTRG